jgi:hypothetical protein
MKKLRALVREHGSQQKAADVMGVSRIYFGEVLRGTRAPGPKILNFFDVEPDEVRYVKRGGTR